MRGSTPGKPMHMERTHEQRAGVEQRLHRRRVRGRRLGVRREPRGVAKAGWVALDTGGLRVGGDWGSCKEKGWFTSLVRMRHVGLPKPVG